VINLKTGLAAALHCKDSPVERLFCVLELLYYFICAFCLRLLEE